METTEKIVEAYVRYVKGWATIPNIKCKGQYEIDLLAIDPKTGDRYHVESTVSVSRGFSKLTADPFDPEAHRQRVKKARQRRTIEFFHERKFTPPEVLKTLAEYGFRDDNYSRVVVSWDWTPEAEEQAASFGIELWRFPHILNEISETLEGIRAYFADDTLRTLQLFARAKGRTDVA
jgi:hypothetical protein